MLRNVHPCCCCGDSSGESWAGVTGATAGIVKRNWEVVVRFLVLVFEVLVVGIILVELFGSKWVCAIAAGGVGEFGVDDNELCQ